MSILENDWYYWQGIHEDDLPCHVCKKPRWNCFLNGGTKVLTKSVLLIALQLGSAGADAYYTHRNMQFAHGYEMNPIARPFVKSTGGCVAYFSLSAGTHILGAHLLHKRGHDRLADALLLEGIADHTNGVIHSATH